MGRLLHLQKIMEALRSRGPFALGGGRRGDARAAIVYGPGRLTFDGQLPILHQLATVNLDPSLVVASQHATNDAVEDRDDGEKGEDRRSSQAILADCDE